jgi:DNA-binding MarR family transcriptional regulator
MESNERARRMMDASHRIIKFLKGEKHRKGVFPKGLSINHYRVLSMLSHEQMGACDMAEHLGISRPAMTAIVGGLVKRGWMHRAPAPSDRRRLNLTLTPAGQRVIEDLRRRMLVPLAKRFNRLSASKRLALENTICLLEEMFP